MSIHNVFLGLDLDFLRFSQVGKPILDRYTRNYYCRGEQSQGLRVSKCRYRLRSCEHGMIHVDVTKFMQVQWWCDDNSELDAELVSKGHKGVMGCNKHAIDTLSCTGTVYINQHQVHVKGFTWWSGYPQRSS